MAFLLWDILIFVLTSNLEGEIQAISCHIGIRLKVHEDRSAIAVEIYWMTV